MFLINLKLYVLKLMHRVVYNADCLPSAITSLFNTNINTHNYNTRCKYEFNMQNVVSNRSISFFGPSLWIKLPKNVRLIVNPKLFFNACKNLFINETE